MRRNVESRNDATNLQEASPSIVGPLQFRFHQFLASKHGSLNFHLAVLFHVTLLIPFPWIFPARLPVCAENIFGVSLQRNRHWSFPHNGQPRARSDPFRRRERANFEIRKSMFCVVLQIFSLGWGSDTSPHSSTNPTSTSPPHSPHTDGPQPALSSSSSSSA